MEKSIDSHNIMSYFNFQQSQNMYCIYVHILKKIYIFVNILNKKTFFMNIITLQGTLEVSHSKELPFPIF